MVSYRALLGGNYRAGNKVDWLVKIIIELVSLLTLANHVKHIKNIALITSEERDNVNIDEPSTHVMITTQISKRRRHITIPPHCHTYSTFSQFSLITRSRVFLYFVFCIYERS